MIQEYTYTGTAFATTYTISIVSRNDTEAKRAAEAAQSTIIAAEAEFSRFLPQSPLSILNRTKSLFVSPLFIDVVTRAYELYQETGGIFNPLVQIDRLGYSSEYRHTKDVIDRHEPYNIDFSATEIDREKKHITLAPGQKIDLGGILKGYLAEYLTTQIQKGSDLITGVIVNLGGDIATVGRDAAGLPFTFSIYNPITNTDIEGIVVTNASLATSGTYKRTWKQNDTNQHHIVAKDGRENPKTTIVSASIIHKSGCTAEAYAKVFLSHTAAEALTFPLSPPVTYLTITADGTITTNLVLP